MVVKRRAVAGAAGSGAAGAGSRWAVPSDVRDRVNAGEMALYAAPDGVDVAPVDSLEALGALRAGVEERRSVVGFRQKVRREPTMEAINRELGKSRGNVNVALGALRVATRTLSYFRNDGVGARMEASSKDIEAMQRMVVDPYRAECGKTGKPDHELMERLLDDALRRRPGLALLALDLCSISRRDADNASAMDSLPDDAVDMPKPAGNMFSGIGAKGAKAKRLTPERRRNDVRFIMGTDFPAVLDYGIGKSGPRPDLAGVLFGVMMGRGTNARKNKSGRAMETLFHNILSDIVAEYPQLHFEEQVTAQRLRELGVCRLEGIGDDPTFDAVLWSDYGDLYIIETNFYADSGSKPIAIADGYVSRGRIIERANEGVHMCVFTDGVGWCRTPKSFAKLRVFFGRGLATFGDIIDTDGAIDVRAAVRAFAPVYYANHHDAINADEVGRKQARLAADKPTA